MLYFKNSEDCQLIPFAEISFLFQTTPTLYSPISLFKQKMIQKIVGKEDYVNIVKRERLFVMVSMNTIGKFPRESCCAYLKRKLITHKPNPNHSDYRLRIDEVTSCVYLDAIVSEIRKRYGYCRRCLLMSNVSYSSSDETTKDYLTKTINAEKKSKKNSLNCSYKIKRTLTHSPIYDGVNSSEHHRNSDIIVIKSQPLHLLQPSQSYTSKIIPTV